MDKPFQVIITNNNENILGELITADKHLSFEPLTILTELSYSEFIVNLEYTFFDDFDYEKEFAFGEPLLIDNRKQYCHVVKAIKYFLLNSYRTQAPIELFKVEFLKPYFDISFSITPINLIEDSIASRLFHNARNLMFPFHYSYYSLEDALNCRLEECHQFFYDCNSYSEVIYAILHFLAIKGYKINKCRHCGLFFATKSLKQQYCNRNSPCPNFKHLSCEPAVRDSLQKIRRQYNRIYNNLQENYLWEHFNKFASESAPLLDALKSDPTSDNIQHCFDFFSTKKWYTKDKMKLVGERMNKKGMK